MKQSIDSAWDDHPAEPEDQEDTPPTWWIVSVMDVDWAGGPAASPEAGAIEGPNTQGVDDLRVQLVLEVAGGGERVAAHLAPSTARRLRAALATALTTIGEPVD